MRSTHLNAHMRSHRDDVDKPYVCTHDECGKRFWTAQHLHRHMVSCHTAAPGALFVSREDASELFGSSSTSGLYSCEKCELYFAKRKHLRAHIRERHADGDEVLPFACEFPGCHKRFPTNSKREHHARVHRSGRYQCVLPHHGPVPAAHPPYTEDPMSKAWVFVTWTQLQRHHTLCHPPTCPTCGKSCANRDALRKHMRTHDHAADPAFPCPWNGCEKALRSAYALQVHISRVHEGGKPFECPICQQRFGYKHLLQRHLPTHEPSATQKESEAPVTTTPHLSRLLGTSRKRARRERVLTCPWDALRPVERPAVANDGSAPTLGRPDRGSSVPGSLSATDQVPDTICSAEQPEKTPSIHGAWQSCTKKFARLYDLRRHLASVHHLNLTDDELRPLIPDTALAQLPAARQKRQRIDEGNGDS